MNQTGQVIGSILVVALALTGFYVFRASQSTPDTAQSYLKSGLSVRPTTCQGGGATDFVGTLYGVFYFDGKNMRADITRVLNSVTTKYHVLSTDAETFRVWTDTEGKIMSRAQFNAQYDFSGIPLQCDVWVSPDALLFELPPFTPFT